MGKPNSTELELKQFNKDTKALKLGFDKELTRLELDKEFMAEMQRFSMNLEKELNKVGKSKAASGKINMPSTLPTFQKAAKSCCAFKFKYVPKDPNSPLPGKLNKNKGVIKYQCGYFDLKLELKEKGGKGVSGTGTLNFNLPF